MNKVMNTANAITDSYKKTDSIIKELTKKYGKGYTKTNLYNFYKFYKYFPEIFHSASGKSAFKLYLPTEEELREEIETQKAIFYLQQKDD